MDDQQTYLLNGLIARQFGLGRIVRFRKVDRGRQAATFELFTAQEKEYLVQLFPAAFGAGQLEFVAESVNRLDGECFSVVPFLAKKVGDGAAGGTVAFVGEGPQGSHMVVSLAPEGSVLSAAEITEHDVSQIGLRLAWMHRLLKEQLGVGPVGPSLSERLGAVGKLDANIGGEAGAGGAVERLIPMLGLPAAQGWAHGDIPAAGLLFDADHQIRTVTDWGLLHVGSPLEDVVDAFLGFCADAEGRLLPERGRALLEAYHSLIPISRVPWTPVVASWCAQRLLDAHARRRGLPMGFQTVLRSPENLVTALAGSL